MKMTKYLFGLALLALGMSMTSCDQENEGAIYNSAFNNVTWEQKSMSTITAEEEIVVPVMITRNHKDGALTVNYTTEASDPDVLSDDGNGKVTFAAGEATALVNVKATNLEKGQTYTYKMTLDDAAVADVDTNFNKAYQTITVKIVSDYTWEDAGTCTFIDNNFYDAGTVEGVQVVQALENKTIFRIIKPYQKLTEGTADEADYADADNIEFHLKADGSPDYIVGPFYVAGYGMEYFTSGGYAGYCTFVNQGNYFIVNHLISVDGAVKYLGEFEFIYDVPSLQ